MREKQTNINILYNKTKTHVKENVKKINKKKYKKVRFILIFFFVRRIVVSYFIHTRTHATA